MKKLLIVLPVLLILILSSCASKAGVTRVAAGAQADLSGNWNANDVRQVCEELIDDCLSSQRVNEAVEASDRKLTVIVGNFRNQSNEHIDTALITNSIERAIINNGKLEFVAGGATRDALRQERDDQLGYASEDTQSGLGYEVGADFMLSGSVKTITDKVGNRTVKTYYVDAQLTNIETNARLWMGQSEVAKDILQARTRM